MDHDQYSEQTISDILHTVKSFAMVGASANRVRPSFFVLKYLIGKGYTVYPINPGQADGEILGQKVYASLADLKGPVDVVDIFRNSEAALPIVKQAIELKDELKLKVIWMQLGIRNDEAAQLAEDAGFQVIMNRCPKIEYGRLSGEIGWIGVNNRMVSSQKPKIYGTGFQQFGLTGYKPPAKSETEV